MKLRKKLIIANLIIVLIGLIAISAGILFFTGSGELTTGEKNILVCAIDEGEPRPGMGACDMAFLVQLKDGEIVNYTAIYPHGLRHPTESEPPEAQAQGAGEKLLLHEAFWYNDTDQSMKNAKEIVEYNTNMSIDAVVALNSEALDAIISAASPLEIDGTQINANGIDFIRDEQSEDGLSRGDAVMEVVKALAQSADNGEKRPKLIQTALDQYSKGNIVMDQQGAFMGLLASKGINSLFN
ncbi:MAG: DUF4012 domain-containing protein [Methanobrevibacter sp.]|jgi:hypothetical protein|nr:DUF4012 domain-containing protein [Methanobrevibacter sp.]